jgi:hypothetical protein
MGSAPQAPAANFSVVPVWFVGDKWNYTTDDSNYEQKYTVTAIENNSGVLTYKSFVSTFEQLSTYPSIRWDSVADLGMRELDIPNFDQRWTADCEGIFPLQNRSMDCHGTLNYHHDGWPHQNVTVGPVEVVQTPAGAFQAVKLCWWVPNRETPRMTLWYSPTVGNVVQFQKKSGLAKLVSTNYTENHAKAALNATASTSSSAPNSTTG